MVALSIAAQFDWPAYYIAFFVFSHALVTGFRTPSQRFWRPELTYVSVLSAVTMANFVGFFAFIYSLMGGLDEMFHAFQHRTGTVIGAADRLFVRSLDLYGWPFMVLVAAWLGYWLHRAARRRLSLLDWVPMFFFAAQLIHSAVFKNAGYIHSYWTYHLGPCLAIGGAMVLRALVDWMRHRSRNQERQPWRAPLIATALVMVAVPQLVHAWKSSFHGYETGRFAYFQGTYEDRHEQVAWAKELAERYPRGTARFLIHPSAQQRIEVLYYLDTPWTAQRTLGVPAKPPVAGLERVLLLDIQKLDANQLEQLAAVIPKARVEVWADRFVAIGHAATPSFKAWTPVSGEGGLLHRWLIDPKNPPQSWKPRHDLHQLRAELLSPPPPPAGLLLGSPERGASVPQRCTDGQMVVSLHARLRHHGPQTLAANLRLECGGGGEPNTMLNWVSTFDAITPSPKGPGTSPVKAVGRDKLNPGSLSSSETVIRCPANHLPVGIVGHAGELLDSIGLLCRRHGFADNLHVHQTSPFGGRGGRGYRRVCPEGKVLVGLKVRAEALITAVAAECAVAPEIPPQKTRRPGPSKRLKPGSKAAQRRSSRGLSSLPNRHQVARPR